MAIATATYDDKTEEQQAIIEMVRQFVDEQIIPNAEEYDHEDKFPEPIVEQMKDLGLFGVTIPEEYGGMGLDLTTYTMIVEEKRPRAHVVVPARRLAELLAVAPPGHRVLARVPALAGYRELVLVGPADDRGPASLAESPTEARLR